MIDDRLLIAVDIGNTAVKVVACHRQPDPPEQRLTRWTASLWNPDWPRQAVQWVLDQLPSGRRADAEPGVELQWRVASVHRASAQRLLEVVSQHPAKMPVTRISYRHVPMAMQVEHPERLGIDRLLGAWAAHREFRAPLVVVDIGSAITIDRVSGEGIFLGGAILPGLQLQFAALASGTDALPHVDWRKTAPLQIPGTNTEDAIRLGIIGGVAGSIDRIVEMYYEGESAPPPAVVLTGGDAPTIAPLLKYAAEHRPDLVCRALLDLPRWDTLSPAANRVEDRPAPE